MSINLSVVINQNVPSSLYDERVHARSRNHKLPKQENVKMNLFYR